jgi:hypothetical protein
MWVGSLTAGVKPGTIRHDFIKLSRSIPGVISLQLLKKKEQVHIYVICRDKNKGPSIVNELRIRFKEEFDLLLDTKNKPDSKAGKHN